MGKYDPKFGAEYQRRWRAAHPESVKRSQAKQAARYSADPAYRAMKRAHGLKHYYANVDANRAQSREWYRQNRNRQIERMHGLAPGSYETMCRLQNNRCAICNRPDEKKLQVDHDHTSGVVRGLLCHKCNKALGLFSDQPEVLIAALSYLDKPRKEKVA